MASTITKSVSERATDAAKMGRKLLPQWRAFARVLARKSKMPVKLHGSRSFTDGDAVWLRLPIELGDDVPHDKALCGRRNPDTKVMMCPACEVLDSVNTTVFHEIAHIMHGTFEAVSDADRLRITDDAIRVECGGSDKGSRAAKIIQRIDRTPESEKSSWMAVAHLVSPFLPMLLNAVEDVWVNAEMMSARPGTKSMFAAQTHNVFNHGVQSMDGEIVKWSDRPLNSQVIIGVYCKGSGLDYRTWLDPKVVDDLSDKELTLLCSRISSTRSIKGRYQLSIKILEALRRLGYLKSDDDPEDEPDPGEGTDDDDSEEGSGDGGDGTEGDDDADADDDTGDGGGGSSDDDEADGDDDDSEEGPGDGADDADDAEAGDDDDGSGGSGDGADDADDAEADGDDDMESTGRDPDADPTGDGEGDGVDGPDEADYGDPDTVTEDFEVFGRHDGDDESPTPDEREEQEAIERAVNQGEHFDQPSRMIEGLTVYTDQDGHRAMSGPYRLDPTPETILAPSLAKLRIAFSENQKWDKERNLKRGRGIDRKQMARRIATDDPRMFTRRNQPGKRDYFVVLGLDVSGSTMHPGVLTLIKEAAQAQADLLARLGVPFAIYAHSGDCDGVTIFQIKQPTESWNDQSRERLARLTPFSANLDGHTLEFYRKRAEEHRATDKLILYYTDGAMPLENYYEELEVLQRNIKICREQGIKLVGVGVRNDDPNKHGLDTIRIDTLDDLPKMVTELGKRLA